jgi:hypothetical protein
MRINRFITLTLVILLAVGTFAIAAPGNAQAICSPAHIVQPGENLFRIGLAYHVGWPELARLNRLANPNYIFVGQVICLPGSVPSVVATPPVVVTPPIIVTAVPGGVYYPPAGIFPSINFNTRSAAPGDTIQITGINFPGNATVDIFIAPVYTAYPATPSGSATIAADGTLNTNFTVPTDVAGVPLRGWALSVLVKARVTGYYGYNYFVNTRP